jgi:hypothetical protein
VLGEAHSLRPVRPRALEEGDVNAIWIFIGTVVIAIVAVVLGRRRRAGG